MVAYISMYVIVWCLCIDVVYGLIQFGIIIVWPFMQIIKKILIYSFLNV